VHEIPGILSSAVASCSSASASCSFFFCWSWCFFSFWRRLFSPGTHKWQNLHWEAFSHPCLWKNAQGLHVPSQCPVEPIVGKSAGHTSTDSDACGATWAPTHSFTDCGDVGDGETIFGKTIFPMRLAGQDEISL
jgi:hypothetical protein